MSTGIIPARATASNTACTNDRPAGNPARSEVWLTNTRPVCIPPDTPQPACCTRLSGATRATGPARPGGPGKAPEPAPAVAPSVIDCGHSTTAHLPWATAMSPWSLLYRADEGRWAALFRNHLRKISNSYPSTSCPAPRCGASLAPASFCQHVGETSGDQSTLLKAVEDQRQRRTGEPCVGLGQVQDH